MRYSDPIGFMLTFTTYGTWLHGDERWSVERKGPERFRPPNHRLVLWEQSKLKFPPLLLSGPMRRVVREAIERDCEVRQNRLPAVNVRTNHVHAVVVTLDGPDSVLNKIKAWATRGLRLASLTEPGRPVWTKGGSRRWLWTPEDVELACGYVNRGQGPDLLDV